jgi:hypothetical protein
VLLSPDCSGQGPVPPAGLFDPVTMLNDRRSVGCARLEDGNARLLATMPERYWARDQRRAGSERRVQRRYGELRAIDATDFSFSNRSSTGPTSASGIHPAKVKIVGVDGWTSSAAEYRMVLGLGAWVVLIRGSDRSAQALGHRPRKPLSLLETSTA